MDKKNSQVILYCIVILFFTLAGIILILIENSKFGAGITPDSVSYIREVNRIINGKRIEFLYWAPLYPILLSVIINIGKIGMQETILTINLLSFTLTMLVVGLICWKRVSGSIFLKIICVFIIFSSLLFLPIYQFALTESIFILFCSLYLYIFDLYIDENKTRYVIITGIILAFSCLLRYAGVVFVFVGIINLTLFTKKKRDYLLKMIILFAGISLTPISLWLLRNKYLFGSFTGSRPDSIFSYRENIASLIQHIYGWYIPDSLENPIILIIITVLVAIGLYKIIRRNHSNDTTKSWIWAYISYIAIYLVSLIPLSSSAFWQLLDDRYLSPVMIPINVLLISFINELIKSVNVKNKTFRFGLTLVCSILLLLHPAKRMIYAVVWHYEAGIGFTSDIWKDSDTIRYLKNNNLDCDIYSNGPDAIYYLTNTEVYGVPNFQIGVPEFGEVEQNLNDWTNNNKCIVWFNTIDRNYLYPLDELISYNNLRSEIILGDGRIYFLH